VRSGSDGPELLEARGNLPARRIRGLSVLTLRNQPAMCLSLEGSRDAPKQRCNIVLTFTKRLFIER
jgi:hypothetical protein